MSSLIRPFIRKLPQAEGPDAIRVLQTAEPFFGTADIMAAARWGAVAGAGVLWFSQPWEYFRSLINPPPEE